MPIPGHFPIPEGEPKGNNNTKLSEDKKEQFKKLLEREEICIKYSEIIDFLPYLLSTLAKICLENNTTKKNIIPEITISTNSSLIKSCLSLFTSASPDKNDLPKDVQVIEEEQLLWGFTIFKIIFKNKETLKNYIQNYDIWIANLIKDYIDYSDKQGFITKNTSYTIAQLLENKEINENLEKLILLTLYFEYKRIRKESRKLSSKAHYYVIDAIKKLIEDWFLIKNKKTGQLSLTEKWINLAKELIEDENLLKLLSSKSNDTLLKLQTQFI